MPPITKDNYIIMKKILIELFKNKNTKKNKIEFREILQLVHQHSHDLQYQLSHYSDSDLSDELDHLQLDMEETQ